MRRIKIIAMMVLVVGIVCFGFSQFTQALYQEDGAKKQMQKEGVYLDEQGRLTPSSINQIIQEGKPEDLKKITQPEYAPGEVIVKFKPDVVSIPLEKKEVLASEASINVSSIRSLNQKYGLIKMKRVFKPQLKRDHYGRISLMSPEEQAELIRKKFPQRASRAPRDAEIPDLTNIYKLTFSKDANVMEIVEEYKKDPNVEYAQPNYKMELYTIPNDPYYSSSGSWGQSYEDMWGLHKIDTEHAWDIEKGSSNVIVAVIDTGIDYNHEDLKDNVWINTDEIPGNRIDDDNNGYIDDYYGYDFSDSDSDPSDYYGHGTHCAGTIAAVTNNSKGVAGISWYSKIMSVKIFPNAYDDVIVKAIEYAADNGADVLSNSWGPSGRLPSNPVIEDAVRYAYNSGCVVVFAAGNNDDDVAYYSPANMPETIAVAATDPDDKRASFSNYGSLIDVSAPGVDVLSLRAEGTDMYGDEKQIVGEKYYRADGTSMACPHVAGLATLVLNHKLDFKNKDIVNVLRVSADDLGDPGRDVYFGFGRINAYRSLRIEKTVLIYSTSYRIDDSIRGNNDSLINPGETVNFIVTLKNSWLSASNVVAKLISEDRLITVVSGSVLLGFMGEEEKEASFQIQASADISDFHPISFELHISADGGHFFKESFYEIDEVIPSRPQPPYQSGWPIELHPFSYFHPPTEIAIGDVNNDGRKEVVVYYDGSKEYDDPFSDPTRVIDSKLLIFDDKGQLFADWQLPPDSRFGSDAYPILADIDGDGDLEIFVGYYAFHHDGTKISAWPKKDEKMNKEITITNVADLDKDGEPEVIGYQKEGEIYIWDKDGQLLPHMPIVAPIIYTDPDDPEPEIRLQKPALGDLDGDGDLEIITVGRYYYLPWGDKPTYIASINTYAWHHTGEPVTDWPQAEKIEGKRGIMPITKTPSVGDIDGDGKDEVALVSIKLIFFDGIFIGNKIYVWQGNGALMTGWPKEITDGDENESNLHPTLSLADIDEDGKLEIIGINNFMKDSPSYSTKVYIFNGEDGSLLDGWPKEIPRYEVYSHLLWDTDYATGGANQPIIADISGDEKPDLFISLFRYSKIKNKFFGRVFAWQVDGSDVTGFPFDITTEAYTRSLYVSDLDLDGDVEIGTMGRSYGLGVGSRDKCSVYFWDLDAKFNPRSMEWPMYKHDVLRTNRYSIPDPTPPTTPIVTDEGDYTDRLDQLYASWKSEDKESGISEYQYMITKKQDGDAILVVIIRDWTSTGTAPYVTAGGLSLTPGKTYYFGVKARNGAGLWSDVGYSDGITVMVNQPPIAYIRYIYPNPAYQGQRVYFYGEGRDKDGYITEYSWRSSIDGFLSNRKSFSTNKLSIGTHTIYFKVKDNQGAWSEEVRRELSVIRKNRRR